MLFVSAAGVPELALPPAGALARLLWLAKAVRCEPLILSSFASLVRPALASLLRCYKGVRGCSWTISDLLQEENRRNRNLAVQVPVCSDCKYV